MVAVLDSVEGVPGGLGGGELDGWDGYTPLVESMWVAGAVVAIV